MTDQDTTSAEIRERVHSGLRWVGASLFVSRTVVWGSRIALAWLLARSSLGLAAWAVGITLILSAFREIGFGQAFIRRRDADAEETVLAADTVFWITAAMNTTLFVVAFLATPAIASYFPKMGSVAVITPILRTLLFVFLIDTLSATPSFVLQKRMQFNRHAIGEMVAGFINAVVAIVLAVLGFDVWSIVIGELAARSVTALIYLRLSRWRPRLRFDPTIARELFAYGRSLWLFSALSAVGGQADRQVLGKLLGSAQVGAYSLAFGVCHILPAQIAGVVNRIAFPALAKIADDSARLRRGFLKALTHIAVLVLPMGIGLYSVAGDFVTVVYGPKWAEAIALVEVLVLYGMLLAISSVAGPVLMAIGKQRTLLYTSIVHHAILFSAMFALVDYGAVGIAWAVVLPMLSSATISGVLVVRYLSVRPVELLWPLTRIAFATLPMYFVVTALRGELILWCPRWVTLCLVVAAGVAVYVVALRLVNRDAFFAFRLTLRDVLLRKRRS